VAGSLDNPVLIVGVAVKSIVEQLPVDDIRRVTQLLSRASLSKIEAVKAEAVAVLLADLARYWETVSSFEALKQHEAIELVPFFERYVGRRYDAYAEELLPHHPDVGEYTMHLAMNVTDSLINEIRPKSGFMPKFPLSGEWTELLRILKDRPEGESLDLTEPDGNWEVFVQRSFGRQVAKARIAIKRWDAANLTLDRLWALFHLKFRFYLRLFPNWYSFDLRLRAHLSHRLEYWVARAYAAQLDKSADPRLQPDDPGVRRKRGRPQTITDEKKSAAAKLKAAGGTNREAAVVLYDTKFPTAQQKKNVPAILRHHQEKSKQSSSPGKRRKSHSAAP
jgi:hypothetical protein